jgi:NAD(P)-dependent dehydrogenase (short-subunit alcohol dehydrogenase family)
MKLQGKVAIVTGAGKGLGRGIASCLAEEGANLAVCSRTLSEVESLAEEVKAIGRKAMAAKVDVTEPQEVKQFVDSVAKTFGRIDILVNNVGAARKARAGIVDLDDNDWDNSYRVNLKSTVDMCRSVVPQMRAQRSGRIINISSVVAKMGVFIDYGSMKGAVISFTWGLARELAKDNINVNCVCPGLIYTPLWEKLAEEIRQKDPSFSQVKEPKAVFEAIVKRLVPLGREQTPEDIGRAVVFLASEDARNITGQTLNIDGGTVMD